MSTVKDSSVGEHVECKRMRVEEEDQDQLCPRLTINILPDNVLLEIFCLYLDDHQIRAHDHDAWHTLVHICRQWRNVVFASPQRLNLQLRCSAKRPVKKTLHVWPELPILICSFSLNVQRRHLPNIIAALEEHNRVCDIYIDYVPDSLLKSFAAMKNPFPAITRLFLRSLTKSVPVLPDSFLGGSAPRLRELELDGIPFPALPKLLLSTSDLVYLSLLNIPRSGYISPEAIVAALSVLTRLKSLSMEFRSSQLQTDQASRHPPPLTRVTLHTLTFLGFKGNSEYLEDIVSRIDAPLLDNLAITFFNQLVSDTPLLCLSHFISRTQTFNAPHLAHVLISDHQVYIRLYRKKESDDHNVLVLRISCEPSDSHLSLLVQLSSSTLPHLPTLEYLNIYEYRRFLWDADTENTQWREALRPFTSVKDLYLSEKSESVQLVAPVLSDLVGESVAGMLPALQNLHVKRRQQSRTIEEAIDQFVAVRQLSGRPVIVHHRK